MTYFIMGYLNVKILSLEIAMSTGTMLTMETIGTLIFHLVFVIMCGFSTGKMMIFARSA